MSKLKDVRTLTMTAMLVAIGILLGFFKIPITELIEIRFIALPIAIAGALFGPGLGAVVGILIDVGAFIVKPTGPYFPGFTISAAISGILFGLMLYKKEMGVKRILLTQVVYTLIIGLVVNSINLSMLYGTGVLVLVSARLLKEIVMIPINAFLLFLVLKPLPKIPFVKNFGLAHE